MRCFMAYCMFGLAASAVAAIPPTAREVRTNVVFLSEMPTNMYVLFRAAVESLPDPGLFRPPDFPSRRIRSTGTPTNRAALVARHLQTLDSLRQMAWPTLDGLDRVRYRRSRFSSNDTNMYETAWLVATTPRYLVLLTDDFRVSQFYTNWFTHLERLDFRKELDAVLGFLASTNSDAESSWPYASLRYWHSQSPQYIPQLFRLAYAAAWFGHTNEAVGLAQRALRHDRTGEFFELMVKNEAANAYDDSMRLFDSGAARSEVLAAWEHFIKTFPQSPLSAPLADYVPVLRRQVADFPKLVESTVENPDRLLPAERAEYFLARFPEIPRRSGYRPDSESDRPLDDRVAKLGYAAIPALIEHLSDRRLTRQTSGSSGRPRIVLRVQDLALRCVEQITEVRFYAGGSGKVFSEEPLEAREKVLNGLRGWWREHGTQPPLEGRLAQLEKMPLHERVRALERLVHENPQAVDDVALLRKWAATTNEDERHLLVEPLARRGDLSLLPLLRQRAERGLAVNQQLLLRHGVAEDYAVLRRAQWQTAAKWEFQPAFHASSMMAYEMELAARRPGARQNWIAVPLLADLLERRDLLIVPMSPGLQVHSQTDTAMIHLTQMTGFSGDYSTNAPLWERFSAMNRWLDWWDKQGRERFIGEHPEAKPVFIETRVTPQTLKASALPEWVSVRSANRAATIVYDLPRSHLAALLASDTIRGKAIGDAQLFWFASDEAEAQWFAKTAPKLLHASGGSRQRPPAMRVEILGGAWPDSAGRVWVWWGSGSHWPAIFDGKRWQPLAETELPPLSRSFDGFASAILGAKGAMFFLDTDNNVFLHDAGGWTRSQQRLGLGPEQPDRVRRDLLFPDLFSDAPRYKLVKDAANNVWCADPESGIIMLPADKHPTLRRREASRSGREREEVLILVPLAKGAVVLAVTVSGKATLLAVRRGEIVTLEEFSLPITLRAQTNPIRDSRGWVWLGGDTNSIALNSDGRVVANHNGRALLEDKRKGLWFIENAASRESSVCRWTPGKADLRLPLADLVNTGALAPDGTIWLAAHPNRLARFGVGRGALVLLEEWEIPVEKRDALWCDEAGRVWSRGSGYHRETQLTCYPMRRKAD